MNSILSVLSFRCHGLFCIRYNRLYSIFPSSSEGSPEYIFNVNRLCTFVQSAPSFMHLSASSFSIGGCRYISTRLVIEDYFSGPHSVRHFYTLVYSAPFLCTSPSLREGVRMRYTHQPPTVSSSIICAFLPLHILWSANLESTNRKPGNIL